MISTKTTVKRVAALLFTTFAACGGSNPPATPDAHAQADATPATPDAPSGPATVDFGNGATTCQGSTVSAKEADIGPDLPSEIGDPAAARLTPPSYPFKVTSVSYRLTGMETSCGTNIDGAVTVFATDGGAPPATPVDAQTIQVAASTTDERTLVVTETLPTPITLTQGQDLYVAVQMNANAAQTVSLCLDGCAKTSDDLRAYWSEETAAPFTWDSLYTDGLAMDYAIWATGVAQ